MATPISQLKGTTAELAAKIYNNGVLVWDETKKRFRGHDGSTAGGIEMAREDEKNDGALGFQQDVKTNDYTVLVTDIGKMLVGNKATAINFPLSAAATLTSKFVACFKNINSGAMTVTPNGTELIDGVNAAISIPTGTSLIIKGDGASFRTYLSNTDVTSNAIHNATAKTSLVDADEFGIWDSISTALRKITLANLAIELKWRIRGIGEIYMVDTSKTGVDIPPSSHASMVWIELTAGLTGVGAFNNGKLTSESSSGSAPLVISTAVVSVTGSPMNGQTIDLINTENRFLRPSTSPGTKQNDALQQHWHSIAPGQTAGSGNTRAQGITSSGGAYTGGDQKTGGAGADDSSVRTDVETRVKNVGVKAYMRVK